ncbi:hypothetical protein ACS0TY_022172 [Phlomoides rotata]
MQTDENGSHSVNTEGNSLCTVGYSDSFNRTTPNLPVGRFSYPLTPGESMINISRATIDSSDEFCRMQSGKNTRNLSSYPLISSIDGDDRFTNTIPFPSASMNTFPAERFGSIDNQEKLVPLGTFASPFEFTKPAIASSSYGTMLHGYEGLPIMDVTRFVSSQELVGRVVGRNEAPPVEPSGSYVQNTWGGLNSNSLGSSRFSNELSLSLATSQPSVFLEQCSETSLHNRQMVSKRASCSSRNVTLSSSSYKPPQHTTLLSGSRFVQAMQEILAEIAGYALENVDDGVNVSRRGYQAIDSTNDIEEDGMAVFQNKLLQERNAEANKKHLLTLLQLVDDRYNQCLDEIHTVNSAFHAVTELDPNLHTRFALRTISFMYKNLRERISSHILAVGAHLNEGETREDKTFETGFLQKQWALQQLSKRDHQFWRPQRGLPERSVSVLRAWMFQNFLHPYPKDAEKHLLAVQSGLTRNQVSNWFINARVRLWKPMIEEMCAEMNRQKARKETEGTNYRNHMLFDTRRFTMDGHG